MILTGRQFRPSVAFDLLGWLRRRPCRRRVQQLSLSTAGPQGRVLAPATVARALAAVSSFYEWAVATERFGGENPLHRRRDLALARVPARHQPFTGPPAVSNQFDAMCGFECHRDFRGP